jgi:hypothetical protein
MRKNKSEIYLAIFVIAVIAATAFLYQETQGKSSTGIFPEKLGDMNLALYREGDAAIEEVKNLTGGAVAPENAYIANFRSTTGSKAKFWVSESKNSEEAASLIAAMNSRVEETGMFSESTPLSIEGITVYFVKGLNPGGGLYHYFYAKGYRVFWIQIDNPDEAYRRSFVSEALHHI